MNLEVDDEGVHWTADEIFIRSRAIPEKLQAIINSGTALNEGDIWMDGKNLWVYINTAWELMNQHPGRSSG